jgi:hypothetical protein
VVSLGVGVPVIPCRDLVADVLRVLWHDLACWDGERDRLVRFCCDLRGRETAKESVVRPL